jgi:hypothetical protein
MTMIASTASIQTINASRYLQQLCKHFGPKIPVDFNPETGLCQFPFGTARMRADDHALSIDAEAADRAALDQTQDVIERHLVRFAFREQLGPVSWQEDKS